MRHGSTALARFGISVSARTVVRRFSAAFARPNAAHINCGTALAAICSSLLVLLCYKKPRRQQGHLGRERAKWVAIRRRRVAIEDGLCRSVRTGSAAGRVAGLHTG